jgi:hypothetical protein
VVEHHRATRVSGGLWALATALMAMYLVLFALSAAGRLARPADEVTYGESWLLDGARDVAGGAGLYAPADRLPLMHTAYTPLYYLVVGELNRLVGDHGYTVGRAVSLLATVLGTAALACSVKRLTCRWSAAMLGAGLFLTQNLTMLLWAPMHRVDPLALGFTLAGLALATWGRASAAAIMFLLALATKQTYVVGPIAVACAVWPCRARLVRFAAIVVGGSVVGIGVGQWLTGGWFLWHTVIANGNELDLSTFATLMGSFLQFNGLPVLVALGSLLLPARPGERLWRVYFVGCLLTLPTIAKVGASSNYWLELTAATSAVLALASHRLADWSLSRLVAPTAIVGSLLIPLPAYQATAVEAAQNLVEAMRPSGSRYVLLVADRGAAPYRVETGFVAEIARESGDVLTDNSGLAVAAGKRIAYEFQIFQLLNVEGYWSDRPILDAVAARRFSLVAVMHPLDGPSQGTRWTATLRDALTAAYAPAGTRGGFWLYRPRTR